MNGIDKVVDTKTLPFCMSFVLWVFSTLRFSSERERSLIKGVFSRKGNVSGQHIYFLVFGM